VFFARTTLSSVILCFYCVFYIMVVLVWMPELVQVSRRQNDLYVLTRGLTHSLSESNNKRLCCQNASFTMDAYFVIVALRDILLSLATSVWLLIRLQ